MKFIDVQKDKFTIELDEREIENFFLFLLYRHIKIILENGVE